MNSEAVKHAKHLIKNDDYITDTDWSASQPDADEENKELDKQGWGEFSKWYLGIDTDSSKKTKGRWEFPYGDFKKVHRAGVIAAKQRAAQYDHTEIAQAADELLQILDKREEA
ncbi:MAG: hypothetical protein RLP44_23885 [Aggregatilineales bacterium]